MSSTIQVRIDDDLRLKADKLFKSLGTDTTSAIRMFLTQAVAVEGFPFEIKRQKSFEGTPYESLSEEQILDKLEQSRKNAEYGNFVDASLLVSDLRSKYGI